MIPYVAKCFGKFDHDEIDELKLDFLHYVCDTFGISRGFIRGLTLDNGIMFVRAEPTDTESYNRLCVAVGSSVLGTNSLFRPVVDVSGVEFDRLIDDMCLLYDTWAEFDKRGR
jgi:hypothetical protein